MTTHPTTTAATAEPLVSSCVAADAVVLAGRPLREDAGPSPRFGDDVWKMAAAYHLPNQIEDSVKYRRQDIVMEQQSRISDAYNESLVGKTLTVLVESFDKYAECWFGRTEGDAPDIDGKVFFAATRRVQPGDLISVTVTDTMDWDLIGEMTE